MTNEKSTKNLNQSGYVLYISMIPILIIVAIIAGAGYFLMKGELKLPKLGKDITEVRRLDGFPTVAYTNDIVEKQRLVIKSREELNEFFNTIDSTGQLGLFEDINFEKEYILAVATETLETNGYEIKVNKLYADKAAQSLTVQVEEIRPAENCEVDTQANVAVDLVAISKTDWEIDFERITKNNECDPSDNNEDNETDDNTETSEETADTEETQN